MMRWEETKTIKRPTAAIDKKEVVGDSTTVNVEETGMNSQASHVHKLVSESIQEERGD